MICINPDCNKKYNDKFRHCPYCGTRKPGYRRCSKCGTSIMEWYFYYCPDCGERLLVINRDDFKKN